MEKRNKKGSVAVESHERMLRLRFRYQGKRKCFALGLPSNPVSLRLAQKVADRVACDIANECFDETLNRYRVNSSEPLTVGQLFERFINHKAKSVIPKTLKKYQATLGYLATIVRTLLRKLLKSLISHGQFNTRRGLKPLFSRWI